MTGKTELRSYRRIRLKQKKKGRKIKRKTIIPINTFFGERRSGIGWVSKNLEKEAVKQATEKSFRQTATDIDTKLSKETVRQRVLTYGKKAEGVENLQKQTKEISNTKLKNPTNKNENYKESKGGIIQRAKEFIERINPCRRYIMADGVHVYTQEGKWRECKAGVILKQEGEKIYEEGTFCTWERLTGFVGMLEWMLIKIFSSTYEMIMIGDGADWIRNMRNKIACLKNTKVLWILDWHHLQEKTLSFLRFFDLKKEDELSQEIIADLWRGKTEEAIKKAKNLPFSADEENQEKQKSALVSFETYITNQKEGIIDYQSYQEKGYLIGSGFMEKRNDTLVKNRMVRQKRMQWV